MQHAPTGVAIVATDGRCLAVNGTLASWATPPREPEEFEGETFVLTDASGRAAVERAVCGLHATVEVARAPLLERDGHWRLHVMPLGAGADVCAFTVVIEDLTERALAADAFEASERRFRTLVDDATDAIAVHRNGVLLYINAAGLRMLGYNSADEIVGNPWLDFVHPDQRRAVSERIAELGRAGRCGPEEEIYLRRDGSALVVETSACRVPLDDGLANFVCFRDITERKHLEAELNRTSRMESLGRLAGSVAHDFNNLLAIIQGSLSMARAQAGDPAALAEALDGADAAARRASEVTRQLLTFSRGGEAHARLTEPNRVVTEAVGLVARMSNPDIHVHFAENPDAGSVWMGPAQLHQVLLNLLLNARDAIASSGTIQVRLERCRYEARTRPASRAGEWLLLSVSDTGTGMDSATRARIFEPFFTTKAAGQGTGLGLSTVYGIVRQAGGFIDVDSAPGKGSEFRIHVPLAAGRRDD
ncbi:MAG TPA: ATP-binding protein [Polyangiaceae bacterium]